MSTLRLTTASLAARCDLTVDDIEDLRLAVDEACALLLPHAGSRLAPSTPRSASSDGELAVDTSVHSTTPSPTATASPGPCSARWPAPSTSTQVGDRLTITVTKIREAATL